MWVRQCESVEPLEGQPLGDGGLEIQTAGFGQQQDGRGGGDDLGERRQVVSGIRVDRFGDRGKLAQTAGSGPYRASIAPHTGGRTGCTGPPDRLGQPGIEAHGRSFRASRTV